MNYNNKHSVLDFYRLGCFFTVNAQAKPSDGEKKFGISGTSFYYNCVYARDSKGIYSYESMSERLSAKLYSELKTRYPLDVQKVLIKELESGARVHDIADRLKLHYQHVTIFSIVYRTAYQKEGHNGRSQWVPYAYWQIQEKANQLREYYEKHGRLPDGSFIHPDLQQAIREFFVIDKDDPLYLHPAGLLDKADEHDEVEAKKEFLPSLPSSVKHCGCGSSGISERLCSIERLLNVLVNPPKVSGERFSSVEKAFALDVSGPYINKRWISKQALALFPKLIRGGYSPTRDEDSALFELEQFGLIEMPHIASSDLMGGITVCRDKLMITDKGWSLQRLIQDICETAVGCCLEDIGSFMGYNFSETRV